MRNVIVWSGPWVLRAILWTVLIPFLETIGILEWIGAPYDWTFYFLGLYAFNLGLLGMVKAYRP